MKSQAPAVVIGGGLVGCSILYHLAKLGWTDSILLERNELTSGSTWHAAANIHGLHDNPNISRLQYYTMSLYKQLEQETGQSCGIQHTGSIYLAQTKDREHQLRSQAAKAKYFDVGFYEIGLDEVAERHPLVNLEGIRCAMYEPLGGYVDPSGVTNAYALGAKAMGAEIHRFTPVVRTTQMDDGSWEVETDKGVIRAGVVINVAGLWGREVAKLAGIELPLIPMEHMYFVTESIPEIAALDRKLPSIADRDGEYYLRSEGDGLLVGAYEKDGRFWAENGTPQDFGHDLLEDDLGRIEENYMNAVTRVPALETAGIKRVINGPMIWSPDSSALFGPVPELRNYYCCNGIVPGFSQSGGLGKMLAQWVVEGETQYDMFAWDVSRFGHWADKEFTKAKALDAYSHRFKIHFPLEERDAGRPMRQRPIYELQKSMGARFGLNYGWEHPLWFCPEGQDIQDTYGYERQPWWDVVGEECKTLREKVGLIDISNFAKYEVKGQGACDWLDQIVANKVPREAGKTCLAPLLSVFGGIAGDFTITCLGEDHLMMVGSGMAERYHQRYFNKVPRPAGVSFESKTEAMVGFNLAGPLARDVLSELTDVDLSNDNWRFMRSKQIKVAGIDVLALRVSFTGDLGWELHTAVEHQEALYRALLTAGAPHGIKPVGGRALLSLRIEKGYGSWGREYSPEYWPQESGLDALIKMDKPDFLGKAAYEKLKDNPPRYKLVQLAITDSDADALGSEPIFTKSGDPCGLVSSGFYSFTTGQPLALAYIRAEYADHDEFDVAVLGVNKPAKLLREAAFDPSGSKLRA